MKDNPEAHTGGKIEGRKKLAEIHSHCTECQRRLIRIYDPNQVKEWEQKIQRVPEKLNGWKIVGRDLVQIHRQSSKMVEIWTDNPNLFSSSRKIGFRGLCPDHLRDYLKEKGIIQRERRSNF